MHKINEENYEYKIMILIITNMKHILLSYILGYLFSYFIYIYIYIYI